jgi:hypothetical protein
MATTVVIPAEAANKAGAACKKANAKTKIGGDNYVCVKNPTVKNAKLTWVWVGCIDSNKLYLESRARLVTITETAAQAATLPLRPPLLPMKQRPKHLIRKPLMPRSSKHLRY